MTAIDDKYADLGGQDGILGKTIIPETQADDGVGYFRYYENGAIYWHPDFGAYYIQGPIRERWNLLALQTVGTVQIFIQAHQNNYLTIRGGSQSIYASSSRLDSIEEFFILVKVNQDEGLLTHGDAVHITSMKNNNYLVVEDDNAVRATQEVPGENGMFTILKVDGEGDIQPGDGIAVQAYNGQYLVTGNKNERYRIKATSKRIRTRETFKAQYVGGGEVGVLGYPIADQLSSSDNRGQFNHFERGSIYHAVETGAYEIYGDVRAKWNKLGGQATTYVYLKASNGQYLTAPSGDDTMAQVRDDGPGPYQTFILSKVTIEETPGDADTGKPPAEDISQPPETSEGLFSHQDIISLQTLNKRYLSAKDDSSLAIKLLSQELTENEQFEIMRLNGARDIQPGNLVVLRSKVTGNYLGIENDLQGSIKADRSSVGMGDVFTIEFLGGGEHSVLGYPNSGQQKIDDEQIGTFEYGSIKFKTVEAPLTFIQQNMALVQRDEGSLEAYQGIDGDQQREQAIQAFVDYIAKAQHQPDVIGLTECFNAEERNQIRDKLREKCKEYEYYLEGPQEGNFLNRDSGLLLLSKYPFTETHKTIYRHYPETPGVWPNRGALHARIKVSDHPGHNGGIEYDIFLTQTQNWINTIVTEPDEGNAEIAEKSLSHPQLAHLSTFIQAYSSPDRPAILMGDLAIDAHDGKYLDNSLDNNQYKYQDLVHQLQPVITLWQEPDDDNKDVTANDPANNFASDPESGTVRYQGGTRPDYFLVWPGDKFLPIYTNTSSVVIQSNIDEPEPSRDISDHYGLRANQTQLNECEITINREIQTVKVDFASFHCLTKTPSVISLDEPFPDHPFFNIIINENSEQQSKPVKISKDGESYKYETPISLALPNIASLKLDVTGWDKNPLVNLDDSTQPLADLPHEALGTASLNLAQNRLALLPGHSTTKVLPLLKGNKFLQEDGGEYAVSVTITVERIVT